MLRPCSLLPALALVLASVVASVVAPAGAAPAAAMPALSVGDTVPQVARIQARVARPAADETPLTVTIDALTPSYIPTKGPVLVTGSVTNNDDAPWSTVYTFAFMSDRPMTSEAELEEAAALDPAAPVGDRITAAGTYDTLDLIEPGESARFSIRVPRSALPALDPGVYWFGVHALGQGPDGRVDGADGRARTFLPLVAPTSRAVDTALVLPVRREITHASDGSLDGLDAWTRTLSPGGRLRSLVDFGASAGSRPLTWLLDPALPDAVRSLTLGNPPRSLAPTVAAAGDDSSDDPDATPEAAPDPPPGDGTSEEDPASSAAAEAGSTWLGSLREGLTAGQILALPYGDVDVAAAAERSPDLHQQARKRSGSVLDPWGLRMSPAVSSPSGYLDAVGIVSTPRDTTILGTDRMFPGEPPPVARTGGARIVPTSSGAASGGPGPGDRLAPVDLRQRILSEAALRLLEPGRRPLVVVLPPHWRPTTPTGFFEGLDVEWLDLTTVEDVADRRGRAVPLEELDYPLRQTRRELDAANFASASVLVEAGRTLQRVLTNNTSVGEEVAEEAMTSVSYASRRHPDAARVSADRSRRWIEARLGSIEISAPRAVTLSSASGRFAATLTNGLEEPVTVSIRAQADRPLSISVPTTVPIAAGGRTTVLLNASTRTPGIHNVTLVVTDTDGTPLGATDDLPIKSAQVSGVIWVILGAGVALLFGAIAVRLFRRVRAAARAAKAAAAP